MSWAFTTPSPRQPLHPLLQAGAGTYDHIGRCDLVYGIGQQPTADAAFTLFYTCSMVHCSTRALVIAHMQCLMIAHMLCLMIAHMLS